MRGDVVCCRHPTDPAPWIGQIVNLYTGSATPEFKEMHLRWFYHRKQADEKLVLQKWESEGNNLLPDDLFISDQIERNEKLRKEGNKRSRQQF